jgi:hypothetical protein
MGKYFLRSIMEERSYSDMTKKELLVRTAVKLDLLMEILTGSTSFPPSVHGFPDGWIDMVPHIQVSGPVKNVQGCGGNCNCFCE